MRLSDISASIRLLRSADLRFASVLDVGVQTSTPVLIEVFSDLPHHLFEPVDDYFPRLRKNYASLEHRMVQAALSDTDGEVHLHTEFRSGDGAVTHSWISPTPTASSRRLRTMRLDTYLGEASPPLRSFSRSTKATRTLEQTSAVVIEMTVERFQERNGLLDKAGFDLWDVVSPCFYVGGL